MPKIIHKIETTDEYTAAFTPQEVETLLREKYPDIPRDTDFSIYTPSPDCYGGMRDTVILFMKYIRKEIRS